MTIGAIGAALVADERSLLLVSHTNTAVGQALLRIAEALAPRALAAGASGAPSRTRGHDDRPAAVPSAPCFCRLSPR